MTYHELQINDWVIVDGARHIVKGLSPSELTYGNKQGYSKEAKWSKVKPVLVTKAMLLLNGFKVKQEDILADYITETTYVGIGGIEVTLTSIDGKYAMMTVSYNHSEQKHLPVVHSLQQALRTYGYKDKANNLEITYND